MSKNKVGLDQELENETETIHKIAEDIAAAIGMSPAALEEIGRTAIHKYKEVKPTESVADRLTKL